jgi:DNA-binding NtrC family response regulator
VATPRTSGTVLVVDDDQTVLAVIAAMLRSVRFNALTTMSCADAVRLLESFGTVTALIAEIDMRGESGIRLAADLRLRQPGLPVLFISATAAEANVRDVPQPWAFIAKPFNGDELADQLKLLLGPVT